MLVMIALLLAASSNRCDSAILCPTDREIVSAIRDYENSVYLAGQNAADKDHPGDVLLMTPQIFRRISGVYCTTPLPDETNLIRCKFTAVRGSQVEYYSGRMKRTPDGWALIEPSIVVRKLK